MLINKDKSCIVIFGMQKDFIPSLIEGQKTIDSCCWLLDLANDLDIPAIIMEHKDFLRASVILRNLPKLIDRVKELEKKL